MDNQLSPQGGSMPSSQLTLDPDQKQKLMLIEAEQKSGLTIDPVDFSKLSGEQNRGISKAVQSVVGDDIESFSSPITSREDLISRGFLDSSLKPTSKGEGAVALIKRGILNKDFTLNDSSKLLLTKPSDFFTPDNAEAQSTYSSYLENNPENYERMLKWKAAKDIGLFDEETDTAKEKPFWDTAWEKTKALGEMASNAGKLLQATSKLAVGFQSPEEELKAKTRIAGFEEGFVETATQSFMNQSAWINKGVNALLEKTGVLTKEQADAQNTFNEYKAASFKDFFDKTKTVAALSSAVGIDDAANQLVVADQVLGKAKSEEIQKGGAQVGALAGDITNIELGPIMQIGGLAIGSGSKLLGSVLNAKHIKQVEQAAAMTAESSAYEARAAEATAKVQLFSGEAVRANELRRLATTAGDTEQAIAHSVNELSWTRQAAEVSTQAERSSVMAQTLRETANGLENTLPPTFGSKIVNAGKLPVALPLKAVGFAAQKFGDTLASVDRGASAFLEAFGVNQWRGLARAASVFTGNINPISIAEGVVASHKLWNGAGRLLNSVGENMLVNQGTVPFFRRVAEDMATPWGKTFATQLDNFIPPVTRGLKAIGSGVGKAAAPSLIYQAINNQGLDANVFKQAAADALVFGGTAGVFKAATVGNPADFRTTQLADRSNFNEKLKTTSPEQYDLYNSKANPSTKDIVSSFSAAYPNAEIKFTTDGPSFQSGNTATINLNNPASIIDSVLTHELKHVIQNIHQSDSLIIQKMVGDKTRKGEIFMKDGSIDPEFMKFGTEYNARMKAAGMPELGINDMAIEFFTDKAAEVLKSDIQSGRFTRAAQESQLSRKTKAIFSAIFTDVPIIKNLHITMGGAIDSSGRLVQGSGLVSEGLTQSKEVQAMVRKMYRESAGMNRESRSMATEGASTRQPRATKSTREGINNGTAAVQEANRAARAQGVVIPDGALDPSTARGRDGIPTPIQVKAIVDSGAIHPDHLGTFPTLVGNMTPDSTSTFLFHYKPAEQGRTTQSAAGETFHHVKPVGVRANKKGNILITGLDVNLWDQNIKKVARSEAAKKLGYTEKQIREDSHEASKYHLRNETPNPYFEQKYGKAEALRRKSLIASTYGMMTESQRNFNPILSEIGMGRPDHVYRTFSLDDIKSATQTNESVRLSFAPNNYYALKVNLMPEAPKVDRLGNLIEDPQMKDFFENHLPNGERFRDSVESVKTTVAEDAVKGQKSNYRYMPQSLDQQISMPKGIPFISKNQSRFLPEPIEKLSAFAGKRVQVLTSDLSIVGNIQHGSHTAEFKGGPGYLDNDGWGFTGKDAADAFVTRWEKDGKPLIGLASLGPANHLNSLDARRAYGEKWKSLVESGEISKQDASTHIQEAMNRIANSDAKSIKPAWKAAAAKITDASTLSEYFDKIPWAAAPVFYDKLTAKTLKLPYKLLVEKGLDLESAAKEYRQPEFHGSELGDLYAIAEYNGSKPEYRPELNKAYPWRIEFSKKATLSEMHNVGDLTTDPRAFAGKQVGGRLGAQPLMVTGINLDRLMAGDLKESGKPLILQTGTAKTMSNPASEFGSGNPSKYTPYQETASIASVKKSKVKTKSSPESISNVAKMK
jgi:hypothetical protein